MSLPNTRSESLQDVKDIRKMMERSSRFLSLSGFSGVAAGICALVGAWVAESFIFQGYYADYDLRRGLDGPEYPAVRSQLLLLAAGVLVAAMISAFYFTWRKSSQQGQTIWNQTTRRLFWNMAIPLVAGGLFILLMLQQNDWKYVAPACLMFYGLALINASKYTLTDIRYLGYCQVALGLLNMLWIGYGLYFWALGFGVLHILYGIVMWWKYDRKTVNA